MREDPELDDNYLAIFHFRRHLCRRQARVGGGARVRAPGQVRVHITGNRFWLGGRGGPRGGGVGGADSHPPRHLGPVSAASDAHGLCSGQTRSGNDEDIFKSLTRKNSFLLKIKVYEIQMEALVLRKVRIKFSLRQSYNVIKE